MRREVSLVRLIAGVAAGFLALFAVKLLLGSRSGKRVSPGLGARDFPETGPSRLVRCFACGTAVPETRALVSPGSRDVFCSGRCKSATVRKTA